MNTYEAKQAARKAAAVGKGGISSDDPAAIEKLQAKLASLQVIQETMKAINAILRRHAKAGSDAQVAALVASGLTYEERARELVIPDYAGRVGFAPYQLQNNNANIHRIMARIKELQRAAERIETERKGEGYTYREDPQENRAMFLFDGKPAKDTRDMLKCCGFRWSPTRNAWVRQLTGSAQWAVKEVIRHLDALNQA